MAEHMSFVYIVQLPEIMGFSGIIEVLGQLKIVGGYVFGDVDCLFDFIRIIFFYTIIAVLSIIFCDLNRFL